MGLDWEQVTVDAADPETLGSWWRDALGWVLVYQSEFEYEIRPSEEQTPGLLFLKVADDKVVKNRLHFDFRPEDHAGEVARLLALGATRVDIGQGDEVPWATMADPEGNEFCVLGEATHD